MENSTIYFFIFSWSFCLCGSVGRLLLVPMLVIHRYTDISHQPSSAQHHQQADFWSVYLLQIFMKVSYTWNIAVLNAHICRQKPCWAHLQYQCSIHSDYYSSIQSIKEYYLITTVLWKLWSYESRSCKEHFRDVVKR